MGSNDRTEAEEPEAPPQVSGIHSEPSRAPEPPEVANEPPEVPTGSLEVLTSSLSPEVPSDSSELSPSSANVSANVLDEKTERQIQTFRVQANFVSALIVLALALGIVAVLFFLTGAELSLGVEGWQLFALCYLSGVLVSVLSPPGSATWRRARWLPLGMIAVFVILLIPARGGVVPEGTSPLSVAVSLVTGIAFLLTATGDKLRGYFFPRIAVAILYSAVERARQVDRPFENKTFRRSLAHDLGTVHFCIIQGLRRLEWTDKNLYDERLKRERLEAEDRPNLVIRDAAVALLQELAAQRQAFRRKKGASDLKAAHEALLDCLARCRALLRALGVRAAAHELGLVGRRIVLGFSAFSMAFWLLGGLRDEVRRPALFEPFAVPAAVAEQEGAGDALSESVRRRLSILLRTSRTADEDNDGRDNDAVPRGRAGIESPFNDPGQAGEAANIQITVPGLSSDTASIWRWVKKTLKIGPPLVSGRLEVQGDTALLHLRLGAKALAPVRGKVSDLEHLAHRAADRLLPELPDVQRRTLNNASCFRVARKLRVAGFASASSAFLSSLSSRSIPWEWRWRGRSTPEVPKLESVGIRFEMGAAAFRLGEWEDALGHLKEARRLSADDSATSVALTHELLWLLLYRGSFGAILAESDSALTSSGATPNQEYGVQRAYAEFELGNVKGAEETLREFLAYQGARSQSSGDAASDHELEAIGALQVLGELRYVRGDLSGGEQSFNEALARAGKLKLKEATRAMREIHIEWASAEREAGRYGAALEHVRAAAPRDPDDASWQEKLASALADAGLAQEARAHYQAVLAKVDAASDEASTNDAALRIRALNVLCASGPRDSNGYCDRLLRTPMGRRAFAVSGRFDDESQQLAAVEKALGDPDHSPRDRSGLVGLKADLLFGLGRDHEAYTALAEYGSDPSRALAASVKRLDWLIDAGRLELAERVLEDRAKARAIDAYSEHRSRGRIAEERGNFPDALEHFRKAHELRPLLEEAQTNYVFALIALEDWQTAKAQALAVLEHHVWLGSDLLGSVLSKEVRSRKPRATSSWPWVEALEEESEAERASIRDVARTLEKVLLDPEQASRDEGGSRGPRVAADDDWARVARLYTIAGDLAGASRALFHVRDSRSSNVRVARALMLLQTRSKPTKEDFSNALFELGMDSRNGRPRATSFARLGRAWEQAGAFTTAKRCFETAARLDSEGYLGKRAEEAAKRLQGADLRPPSHYGAPEDGYCTPSTRVESSSADANDETRHSVTPAPSEP